MTNAPASGFQANRVLLVDDDRQLCQMLGEYLRAEGLVVSAVHDGLAAVETLRKAAFDVVVLDIMMPKLDGLEALRRIRGLSDVPVLILTARGDDVDRIVGLEVGADDYLPKPFNPRELAARLRAILRRVSRQRDLAASEAGEAELRAGDLLLRPGAQEALLEGRPVTLTATEYAVLEILVRSAGRVVSKDRLSEDALGRRPTPFDRSLDTHISNLRRKLGAGAAGQQRIKTIRGQGYLLVREPGA